MELLRPRVVREKLKNLKGDMSYGEFADYIGCDKSNLYEAVNGRRSIPNAAAARLGLARVVAYISIDYAYPPLDNRKKRDTKR